MLFPSAGHPQKLFSWHCHLIDWASSLALANDRLMLCQVLFQSSSFLRGICGLCSLQWIFTTEENHYISPSFPSWYLQRFFTPTMKTTAAGGASGLCTTPLLPPSARTNYFHLIYFLPSYSLNLLVILNKTKTKQSTSDSSSAPPSPVVESGLS